MGKKRFMFAFVLGSFNFEAMVFALPVLGPIFFLSYIMVRK